MPRVEELQPAELDEGDVAPGELDLQRSRVVRGAEEHRLLLQRHPGLAVLQHLFDHVVGLAGVVEHGGDHRLAAGGALGPQVLGVALGGKADHRVGGGEHFRRRAVVAGKRDDGGSRPEAVREVEDVAHSRGAEGVDRLGVVADDGEARAGRLERHEDPRLQAVGVLVLVDQHVIEAAAGLGPERRLRQHLGEVEEEVVVVEDVLALLCLHVAGEQRAELRLPVGAPRIDLGEDLGELGLLVDCARIDGEAGGLQREPLGRLREAEIVADEVDEVGGIAPVVDGEGRVEADLGRAFAQEPRADGVEGAGPRQRARLGAPSGRAGDDPLHPAGHLGGGAAGEGEEQDATRIGALDDQVRHPVGERVGLARAGPGDDEERPVGGVRCGAPLVVVEAGEMGGHGRRINRLRASDRANMIHVLFAIGKG